ncbi:MAG: NirD/YgiW/YdeI family stress tolerance protein, partial [Treponema sp.]|nr:NirD/YgiW/YdeI family stress tolerance protein [Treponema sp.]
SKDKNSKSENNLKQNSHLEGNSQSGYNSQGSQQTAGLATVSDARSLPNNSRVTLQGYIVKRVKEEYFIFRDDTGDITVEIESKAWRSASLNWRDVGPNDLVTISGKLEREKNKVTMEVKMICRATSSNETDKPSEPNEPNEPNKPVEGWIIMFDLNGGEPAPGVDYSTQIVPYGEKMTMPNAPIKEGFVFHAWEEITENFTLEEGFSIEAWRNKEFRANWYPIYTVRFFDADEKEIDSFTVIDEKGAFVEHPELTLPNLDKFRGWRVGKENGPSISITGWPVKITSHTDFYPNYAE